IEVAWTHGPGNDASVTYRAVATPTSGSPRSSQPTSGSSATIYGVANGTQYVVTVVARNAVGEAESVGAGPVTPFEPPGAPVLSDATGQSLSGTAYWQPPQEGAASVTGYRVTVVPVDGEASEPTQQFDVDETRRDLTFG